MKVSNLNLLTLITTYVNVSWMLYLSKYLEGFSSAFAVLQDSGGFFMQSIN